MNDILKPYHIPSSVERKTHMLTVADKFLVALLLAGANVVRSRYDIDFGLTDQMAADIVGFVTAALVWLVPNKSA